MRVISVQPYLLMRVFFGFVVVALTFIVVGCSQAEKGMRIPNEEAPNADSLRVVVDQRSHKYDLENQTGVSAIRIWVIEGGKNEGNLSSYNRRVDRNVGYLESQNLNQHWYFETNDQNIISYNTVHKDISEEKSVFLGTVYIVVSEDTDKDGRLTAKDKSNLYFARDKTFKLLLNDIDGIEQVISTKEDPVLLFRKNDDLYSALLNLETLEINSLKIVQVP